MFQSMIMMILLVIFILLNLGNSFKVSLSSLSSLSSSSSLLRVLKSSSSSSPPLSLLSLDDIGLTSLNTFTSYLIADNNSNVDNDDDDSSIAVIATSSSIETLRDDYLIASNINITQSKPRQVYRSHYTYVLPEIVPSPSLISFSQSCCLMIGLDPKEILKDKFISAFSGNILLKGLDKPYSTAYGSHVYGQWKGQLGDGRVIQLGEIMNGQRYEIQLKGAGRTPYGRGFDGRSVLRSSVREFIASEAMYHLRVPTTRALCVMGTGMKIRRPWYKDTNNTTRRSPDKVSYEPGAILCRISPSFIRFGQLELFAVRKEFTELLQLVNYAIYREYPELLFNMTELSDMYIKSFADPNIYVQFMRSITKSSAQLVADWLRIGYCQGNINSDNVLIGGRTIDYGPFGFMDVYDHYYQPFTSDSEKKYSFSNQSIAMNVNIKTLGQCICDLIDHYCKKNSVDSTQYVDAINKITGDEYQSYFDIAYNKVKASKLGFLKFEKVDNYLWDYLLTLLYNSQADYTIFFRQLAIAADCENSKEAFMTISTAFIDDSDVDINVWSAWLVRYMQRIKVDNIDRVKRKEMQNQANPKFIARNWMLLLAYEKAENKDYSLIEELHELLSHPYDEQSDEMTSKYYRTTPEKYRNMPGVSFLN